jgi:hypothetical protein
MEQLEPAASVAPQAFAPVESAKSPGLVPVMVGTMLFKGAVPEFESVAASAEEVEPESVLGKATGEVRVAVVAALELSNWNDEAHVPEIPMVA